MSEQRAPRVLLVDDEPIILSIVEINLRLSGFEVATCSNGEDALQRAEEFGPDVVVLDVVLPGIDGFEVCRRLRTLPAVSDVPVIMLTAQAQDEDRRRGYALGVQEYLTKPFDPPALVELVRSAVAS